MILISSTHGEIMPCENLKFKRVEIMNKSKFLKKSLAMVLAVMLVVAMIPLGASANSLFVNDGTVVSVESAVGTLEMATDKKSFTDTVAYDATGNETLSVELTGSLTNVVAIITDENGDEGDETVAAGGDIVVPVEAKKVVFFAADDAYVGGDEAGKKSATYTVTMNKPAPSTDVSVKSAILGDSETGIKGTVNNSTKTISFIVPWGYNVAGGNGVVTAELNNPKTGVVPTATVTTIGENVSMSIVSQYGNTDTYTITTKEMDCLKSLTVGGVEAVMDKDEDSPTYGEYFVTLPEGTDLGEELVVKYVVPSTADLRVRSATWGGTELVGTPGKVAIVDGAKVALVFTSTKDTTKTYQVTVSVKKSNDASIAGFTAAATVGEGTVYYDQEGTVAGDKLTVLLPYNANLDTAKVKFTVAEGATITVGGAPFTNDGTGTIDLTAPKVVEVTAVDGVTKKYYEISATTAENPYGNPQITAAKMTIGEDEYTATISGQVITFANLPYATEADAVKAATYSWAKSFATAIVDGNPIWADDPFAGTNTLAIQSDAGDMVTYTLKYTKAAARTGKTVSNYTVSTAAKGENVAADNTWSVNFASNKATVTLPYSFEANSATIDLISSFTLSDGAKLYFNDATTTTNLNTTPVESGYYAEDDADHPDDPKNTVKVDKLVSIVVADEAAVYALSQEVAPVEIATMGKKAAYKGHVSVYTVEVKYAPAKTGHTLRTLTADEGKVTSKVSATTVEITVPYSYAQGEGIAFFADYTADELAKVEAGSTVLPALSSVVDKTIDGTGKLKVVMNGDTPEIQVYNGSSYVPFSTITVTNEANTASTPYAVTVKVADAKSGADIVELTANKTKAVIDTNKKTATVRLPYNTDLTDVVIDYKVSDLATAVVSVVGTPDEDGALHYDATQPISIAVTAEDGATRKVYTVNVTAATQFSDVPEGRYYTEYVYQAAAAGIVNGNPDGTFKPNNRILRKDFAIMVANMLGADVSGYTTTPFSDVANDYAAPYIAYCADKGIISGIGGGKFGPNQYITREDAACIVARALKLPTTSTDSFKDAAKISNYAKASVAACKAAGILSGDEKGNFNPKANIIRADAAIIMVKSLNK